MSDDYWQPPPASDPFYQPGRQPYPPPQYPSGHFPPQPPVFNPNNTIPISIPIPPPPEPPKRRPWMQIITVAAGAVLLLGAGAIASALYVTQRPDNPTPTFVASSPAGPTVRDAERECYGAFSKEFSLRDQARQSQDTSGSTVLATVTEIDILDSRPKDDGFVVNGTVHYDLTEVGQTISSTLELTCTATPLNSGDLITHVENRN